MDYVARAGAAARRWREAQGFPPAADAIPSLSSLSSPVVRTEGSHIGTLTREESATKATEETKEREGGGTGALTHRVTAFRAQLAGWATSGRLGVPMLALPDVEERRRPGVRGCVSCAVPIPESRLRCECCRRAAELVIGLPLIEETAP